MWTIEYGSKNYGALHSEEEANEFLLNKGWKRVTGTRKRRTFSKKIDGNIKLATVKQVFSYESYTLLP